MEPRCCTEALKRILTLRLSFTFSLQTEKFRAWAMLGSNQRPLPCEVRSVMSWLFAAVQKYLQISIFFLRSCRPCSSLFAWVGVLLVYRNLGKLAPTGGFMEIAPPPPEQAGGGAPPPQGRARTSGRSVTAGRLFVGFIVVAFGLFGLFVITSI